MHYETNYEENFGNFEGLNTPKAQNFKKNFLPCEDFLGFM